jgi:hypothetical protein
MITKAKNKEDSDCEETDNPDLCRDPFIGCPDYLEPFSAV